MECSYDWRDVKAKQNDWSWCTLKHDQRDSWLAGVNASRMQTTGGKKQLWTVTVWNRNKTLGLIIIPWLIEMHVNMHTEWNCRLRQQQWQRRLWLIHIRAPDTPMVGGASAADAPVKGHLLFLLPVGSMQGNIQSDTNPSLLLHVSVFHPG